MQKYYIIILAIYVFILPQYAKASVDETNLFYEFLFYSLLFVSTLQILHLIISEKIFNIFTQNKAIWLFVFMFISGISFFWSEAFEPKVHVFQVVKIIVVITPLYFLNFDNKKLDLLLMIFFIGTILGSFQVIYNYYFDAEFYYGIKRSYIKGIDSNESAVLLSIGYCLSIFYFYSKKNMLFLFATTPQIAAVFYTGSRTGFISLLIGSFMALYLFGIFEFKIKSILIVVSLVIGFFFLQIALPPENISRIFNTGEDISTGEMSGRKEIWEHSMSLIPERLIGGYGMNSFADILERTYMRFNAHNVFIKAQFELGIIGIIPLLLWIIISFKKILNNQTEYKPLLVTLFIIILISFMQLSWIYSINLLVINAILNNIAVLKRFETVDDNKSSSTMVL